MKNREEDRYTTRARGRDAHVDDIKATTLKEKQNKRKTVLV